MALFIVAILNINEKNYTRIASNFTDNSGYSY
jgi:hypothetical protein